MSAPFILQIIIYPRLPTPQPWENSVRLPRKLGPRGPKGVNDYSCRGSEQIWVLGRREMM